MTNVCCYCVANPTFNNIPKGIPDVIELLTPLKFIYLESDNGQILSNDAMSLLRETLADRQSKV